jgi:hypothetical protein
MENKNSIELNGEKWGDETFYDKVFNETNSLESGKKYFIDDNNIEDSILKKYILDIVFSHVEKKQINYEKIKIEYSLLNYTEELFIEKDESTNTHPLFSILSFIDTNGQGVIFTNISEENYKYKEIENSNTFSTIIPKKMTHVYFDSSKYYGFFNVNNENNNLLEKPFSYIKINVWNDLLSNLSSTDENKIFRPFYKGNYISISRNQRNSELAEEIIYNTNKSYTIFKVLEILKSKMPDKLVDDNVIQIILNYSNEYNYNYLINEYGKIVDDIMQIKNDKSLEENNIFSRNKIVQNILPKEICYWIINEAEICDKWGDCNYKNYELSIKADCIPHILNFLVYSSNFWLEHFKSIYNIPKNMNVNINDIFISKNSKKSNYKNEDSNIENDGYFICNIQLNDKIDFIGGECYFDNLIENKFNLNQGDMLIYNSLKNIKYEDIIDGESYCLTFILEIKLQ